MNTKRMRKDRRSFLGTLALGSLTAAAAPAIAQEKPEKQHSITAEVLEAAEKIAGLTFSPEEREMMLEDVRQNLEHYQALRKLKIPNEVPPALHFLPHGAILEKNGDHTAAGSDLPLEFTEKPDSSLELAFLPVAQLAELLRTRQISSRELTSLYINRLKKHDPELECLISLTESRAFKAAGEADRQIAAGNYLGPLHGIPWGAKDLLAVAGYPTTWGATPYKEQTIESDATVVERLDSSGAVLIAKLTLGALAWGDVWYGGKTKNPWDIEQGSSGSSAGSASSVAAGLCGFAIGSETWGSIVSPSTRCGTTGLRPTFGRVPRGGAMALSWSMDKLGPIARSAEDCAYIFSAIHGRDELDPSSTTKPFNWRREHKPSAVKIGVPKSLFEEDREDTDWKKNDLDTLHTLEKMGYTLVPFEFPEFPVMALSFILNAEAAAAFDQLTLSNQDDLLVRQVRNAWPNAFRTARMIPAVEYIQANRARTMLMMEFERMLAGLDLYICPSFGGYNLLATNLTGHPSVVLPNGFRPGGTPTSITFMGQLYGEEMLLAVASAYQQETGFNKKHPPAFAG